VPNKHKSYTKNTDNKHYILQAIILSTKFWQQRTTYSKKSIQYSNCIYFSDICVQ